jgi:hypothetical protein
MKHVIGILLFVHSVGYGQLTLEAAKEAAQPFHLSSYSYHEQFIGHAGYGAPIILTADGGAAAFGHGDEGPVLMKFGKDAKVQWKRFIPAKGSEMELQSVVQSKFGGYYVFMLVYDEARFKYRGGCERAVLINKTGAVVWDKYIGSCGLLNSPTVAYIRAKDDGDILLRGQVVRQQPPAGKDPTYLFWESSLNNKGTLTQKDGAAIDWKKTEEWQSKFKPEQ